MYIMSETFMLLNSADGNTASNKIQGHHLKSKNPGRLRSAFEELKILLTITWPLVSYNTADNNLTFGKLK